MKKLKVAVLMGGISAEREISLASGKNVIEELKKSGEYEIKIYDPKTDLTKLIKDKNKIDVAMPVLHGPYGEDGTIQGFLELLQIPYTFSKVLPSALGMNKLASRRIFEKAGIKVPKYIALGKNDQYLINLISNKILMPNDKMTKKLDLRQLDISYFLGQLGQLGIRNFPLVVKPNNQGSSIGVSICQNKKELEIGLKEAFKYDKIIMVEEYIKGKEITGGVLESEKEIALPVVEIHPKEEFFNYKAKYSPQTEEIVPAKISKDLAKKAQKLALDVYKVLGCCGVARVDMIIENQKDRIYVLEINTIPGLTKESLIPKAARAYGISFPELLDKLIELALKEEKIVQKTKTVP